MSAGRSPSPQWRKPSPLGLGVAVDAVSNVAAPLLAGFAVAAIGVVGADSDKFRWPGPVLLCLTVSALLFVTCVQFGFHARRHLYSYADITAWWSEEELRDHRDLLREEQNIDFRLWDRWRGRAYAAYSGGMVMLWVGVSLVLAPPTTGNSSDTGFRWAAAAVAAGAALGEAVWSAYPPVKRWVERRRVLRRTA
ncbi:hypothetical protein ACFS5L_26620 [Streptomyces phyllanthi]|uniref:Uncharacterized protein n=1 Tax=Streptomyces phyllanthi TaxID=1803180 RepID=A0A5N8VYF7_9ACTN|nr:hypothetical protein [Streptomyces phyllanthi]MPY40300.1 hypothetical protein [Streptomyces phyllanthi]